MKNLLSGMLISALLLTLPMQVFASEEPGDAEKQVQWAADCSAQSGNLAFGKDVYCHWSRAHAQNWSEAQKDRGLLTDAAFELFYSNGDAFHTNRGNNWAAVDLGSAVKFDTVTLYPGKGETELCHGFPNAIRLLVTDNAEQFEACADWFNCSASGLELPEGEVIAEFYDLGGQPFEPVTFQFPAVSGRFLIVQGLSLNFEWCEMQLSEIAVYNKGYTPPTEAVNLALGKTVESNSFYEDEDNNWHLTNINDGDRYNMNTKVQNEGDYGQFCGYHSDPATLSGGPADVWLTFDLGGKVAVDEMVIYPSSTKYKYGGRADEMNMPADFEIQISDNGESWTSVLSKTGYEWGEYRSHSFSFDSTEGRYVRFLMKGITDSVKISEIELYSSKPAQNPTDPGQNPPTDTPNPPKTGDPTVALALLGLIGAVGLALMGKKRAR